MINAIINAFLWLVMQLFNIILTPIITAITVLFPQTANLFTYINTFLDYAFEHVTFVRVLLNIPQQAMVLFFDYLLIKYSIYLIRIGVKFAVTVYDKFKP